MYLFPRLIGQSQSIRRSKSISYLIENIRQYLLDKLGAYLVEFNVIDSTSVPLKEVVRAATKAEVSDIVGFSKRFVHNDTYYGTKLQASGLPQQRHSL